MAFFKERKILKILLAGVETHVCVLQTALDLTHQGFQVYGAVDSMGSRSALDHEWGLKRVEKAGVTLTTAETALSSGPKGPESTGIQGNQPLNQGSKASVTWQGRRTSKS